jgi:hypothetical protein
MCCCLASSRRVRSPSAHLHHVAPTWHEPLQSFTCSTAAAAAAAHPKQSIQPTTYKTRPHRLRVTSPHVLPTTGSTRRSVRSLQLPHPAPELPPTPQPIQTPCTPPPSGCHQPSPFAYHGKRFLVCALTPIATPSTISIDPEPPQLDPPSPTNCAKTYLSPTRESVPWSARSLQLPHQAPQPSTLETPPGSKLLSRDASAIFPSGAASIRPLCWPQDWEGPWELLL